MFKIIILGETGALYLQTALRINLMSLFRKKEEHARRISQKTVAAAAAAVAGNTKSNSLLRRKCATRRALRTKYIENDKLKRCNCVQNDAIFYDTGIRTRR